MPRAFRNRASYAALAAVASLALSAGALVVAPTAADAAAAVTASCSASGQVHFDPGVQLFPRAQDVTYQGEDGSCNDYSGLGLTSAALTANFAGVTLSCLASGSSGTGKGTGRIDWTDAFGGSYTSTVDLQIDGSALNTGHLSGAVSGGLFQGHTFTATLTTSLIGGGVDCTVGAPAGGVKNADFTGDFNIT
ncbi:hypothetical protein [Kitasatospora sp. NPDC004531]